MSPRTVELLVPSEELLPGAAAPSAGIADLSKDLDEESTYTPVPPAKSTTRLVRFRFRGRGQPLPYLLEEEVQE